LCANIALFSHVAEVFKNIVEGLRRFGGYGVAFGVGAGGGV